MNNLYFQKNNYREYFSLQREILDFHFQYNPRTKKDPFELLTSLLQE